MPSLFTVDHVTKTFPLKDGSTYVALRDIFLDIAQGEFLSLVGHSGCGKSTLLNLLAGLTQASEGGILMEGRQITDPGPDRMVVFQNYSLLPWKTVRQNIALAVNNVMPTKPEAERSAIVEHHLRLVNLKAAADKFPRELSGGMKQRVAIARALAIRPKLLSDRVVLMTNGPEAHIGQILEVPLPRPRSQLTAVEHPAYYALRGEMVGFLNDQRRARQQRLKPTEAQPGHGLEKVNLELGFIPLTDCAPLVVAQEKGFFARHGLEQVQLRREANWKTLETHVRQKVLDGAQMVAGMPFAMTLGSNGQQPLAMVTALTLSRNGNAITLHRRFHEAGVASVAELKTWMAAHPDRRLVFAMVHPASMHNLILRAWLASGGIDPDRDVDLIVIPPPQMVATLKAGTIDGFCVGDPWNSRAVQQGIGTVIATDQELWNGHCEKVLGVRQEWADAHPRTHEALIKALLEACQWCEEPAHREELTELLARPTYVGTPPDTLRPGLVGPYDRGTGEPVATADFIRFHGDHINAPQKQDGVWILSQLARWGLCPFPAEWEAVADRVQRRDIFLTAAAAIGQDTTAAPPPAGPIRLFENDCLDPRDPLAYLSKHGLPVPAGGAPGLRLR